MLLSKNVRVLGQGEDSEGGGCGEGGEKEEDGEPAVENDDPEGEEGFKLRIEDGEEVMVRERDSSSVEVMSGGKEVVDVGGEPFDNWAIREDGVWLV